MAVTTLSSREFNQDTSRAKQAASKGPVFITDRGRPAHVLLTIEAYQKLAGCHTSIIDQLAMPGVEDIEFDPPRISGGSPRPADLSGYTCSTQTLSPNFEKQRPGKRTRA